jgi:hypothetical protein
MSYSRKFLTFLVASCLLGHPVFATETTKATSPQVMEFKPAPGSAKIYEGTLASKKILMSLSETSIEYTGGYAYISPNQHSSSLRWIDLDGKKTSNGTAVITEKIGEKTTGKFKGKFSGSSFSGIWASPTGKNYEFFLQEKISAAPRFVAEVAGSPDAQHIQKIAVYDGRKLLQSIPVNLKTSNATNELEYQLSDYNFDGQPDFYLTSGDSEQIYLLFSAETKSFVIAPPSLQKIRTTGIKFSTNEIYEEWSHSGYNGMNIYKFNGGKYCLIEQNSVSPSEKSISKKYPISQCKSKTD